MATTLENLMAAFAGESQANRKYLAYAKKSERSYPPPAFPAGGDFFVSFELLQKNGRILFSFIEYYYSVIEYLFDYIFFHVYLLEHEDIQKKRSGAYF